MADIPSDPYAWSTTATSNSPSGATTIGAGLDDNLRAIQAAVKSAISGMTGVAGTNTITATAGNVAAYATGQQFSFVPANTTSGAATLNVNGLGAKSIFFNGVALTGGEIRQNQPCIVYYDGTQFNLIGPFAGGAIAGDVSVGGALVVTGTSTLGTVNSGSITSSGNVQATNGALSAGVPISGSTYCDLHPGTTGSSSLRVEHGVAPTSPVNGDIWTTSAGLFIRINGVTKTVTLT